MTSIEQLEHDIKLTKDVSRNHAFFWNEGVKALSDMVALSFDLSEGSQERFKDAAKRCEVARARCRQEMERLPK